MNKYLKLYSFCKIVQGSEKAIICDYQKCQIKFIPISMALIINEFENKTIEEVVNNYENESETIYEYINFIIDEKFGFYSNEIINFPPVDDNWISPEIINNSIIEYSFMNYNILNLLGQLDNLFTKFLEIRFLNYSLENEKELIEILDFCSNKIYRSIRFYFPFKENKTNSRIISLIDNFKKTDSLIFYNSPKQEKIKQINSIYYIVNNIVDITNRNFNKDLLINNINFFQESQKFNPYYNKKVCINEKGFAKNCLKNKMVFDNVNDVELKTIITKEEFQEFWNVNHDLIIEFKNDELRYNKLITNDLIKLDSNLYSII